MSAPKHVLHTLLDDLGFDLTRMAQSIGYPLAALRAFRSGELQASDPVTHDDIRLKLVDIAIMTSRIGKHRGEDSGRAAEADLFGKTLVTGYTVTGWDLYRYGDGERCARISAGIDSVWDSRARQRVSSRHGALCELAQGEPAEQVLDRHLPGWRRRFQAPGLPVRNAEGSV